MKKFYWIYGGIALVLIVLKIFGLVNWWVVTSPIWFPLGVMLSNALMMVITTDLGSYFKKKEEAKVIPTCENCLFNKEKELNGKDKCFGEEHDAEKKDNKCIYYRKF